MGERVAVVGSRKGVDPQVVTDWLDWLWSAHPDSIVISGGADGVDTTAETHWISLGGQVESYRPEEYRGSWYVSIYRFNMPGEKPHERLYSHPSFEDWQSAIWYRSMLVAECADKLVAFFNRFISRGTQATVDFAQAEGTETHEVR